jgi:hypothetical protein
VPKHVGGLISVMNCVLLSAFVGGSLYKKKCIHKRMSGRNEKMRTRGLG